MHPALKPWKVYVIFSAIVIALFVIGFFISKQCMSIGKCEACWYAYPRSVNSQDCPDPTKACNTEPYVEQHNAIADMLVCACKSRSTDIDKQIEDSFKSAMGTTATADEICGGQSLVKWKYK